MRETAWESRWLPDLKLKNRDWKLEKVAQS